MEWSLAGLPLPIVLRPPSTLTEDELIEFSLKNKPHRIEKNAQGELEIMAPEGLKGGRREMFIGSKPDLWAEKAEGVVVGACGL